MCYFSFPSGFINDRPLAFFGLADAASSCIVSANSLCLVARFVLGDVNAQLYGWSAKAEVKKALENLGPEV